MLGQKAASSTHLFVKRYISIRIQRIKVGVGRPMVLVLVPLLALFILSILSKVNFSQVRVKFEPEIKLYAIHLQYTAYILNMLI